MTRIVRIATSSLATLEQRLPPYNLSHADPQATFARGLALIDAAGAQNADLICLPEAFAASGLPAARIPEVAEEPGGPAFRALAERARSNRINVVAGMFQQVEGGIANVAVLIDRDGNLVGTYSKRHPTENEIARGVVPGIDALVVETDVGKIGLAICFDLNWHALWAELKAQGAEIICWISAFEGGFPLQAYAWLHGVTVVSSVQSYVSKIIDRSGKVLTETSRWGRLTSWDIDLDQRWFHTDGQAEKILETQARFGSRVRVDTLGHEHMFSISGVDPTLDLEDVIAEIGLVEFDKYIARCTAAQQQIHGRR